MDRQEKLMLSLELQTDLAEYWHDVDANWGNNAGSYYTDDAVFEAGKLKLEGREAIQNFYNWREGRGPRTALHVMTNFRLVSATTDKVTASWYMQIFAADGEGVLPTHPPVRICRMTDQFDYDEKAKRWLCTYRLFETLFEGGSLLDVPKP